MKTLPAFLFSWILFTISVSAQKASMKYGKVNTVDLKMTTYEADPNAEAVLRSSRYFLEKVPASKTALEEASKSY